MLADPATAAAGTTALHWAAGLEFVLALACIGTAVALFPVVRRVDRRPRWASWARARWRPPSS